MDQIISLAVAEGLWAVLFCGLLVYQLRDSRRRESNYREIIKQLDEKLDVVKLVKTDAETIKSDTENIKSDTEKIKSDTEKLCARSKRRAAECGGEA